MEALHFGEADLAVCGFTAEFVEADGQAASTYAYIIEKIVVAVEPGTPAPRDIDAQKVVVGDDRRIAALVTAKGGIPVPNGGGFVALPLWQVGYQGLERTPISLRRDRHVMAVPSGENAWLVRLERFLRTEAGSVAGLLAQEAL